MIATKLWERHLLKEFIKFFLFFIASFYFLYFLIDYSSHIQELMRGRYISIIKIAQYYGFQFIKRCEIVLPLSLLITSIRLLCSLNTHHELVAFRSAGFSAKKILRPFFLMAFLCSLLNLAIMEFALPYSLNFIDKFYDSNLRHSNRVVHREPLHVLHLEDQSKLVYQHYDAAKEAFFDVIWIRHPDDLWRMKYLKIEADYPQGQWVDHLKRNKEGSFEKTQSFNSLLFKELKWNRDIPRKGFIPFENRSISYLWNVLKQHRTFSKYETFEILTQLLYKLVFPFFPVLIVIAVTPFCLRYNKNLPQFFIYTFSIFGFVAFVALMDSAVILGESNTLSPFIAILSPFVVLMSFFSWKFIDV